MINEQYTPNLFVDIANFGYSYAKREEEIKTIMQDLAGDSSDYLAAIARFHNQNLGKLERVLDSIGALDKPLRVEACERVLKQRGIPRKFYH